MRFSIFVIAYFMSNILGKSQGRKFPKQVNYLDQTINGTVTLRCDPAPKASDIKTIQWFKNGIRMDKLFNDRVSLSSLKKLRIFRAQCGDQANYTCRFSNRKSVLGQNEFVLCIYDEQGSPCHVVSAPELMETYPNTQGVIMQPESSSLNLMCVFTGNPTPEIIWIKDGEEIKVSGFLNTQIRTKPSFLRNGTVVVKSTLLIDTLTGIHSGKYICRAVNAGGASKHNFNVDIVEQLKNPPKFYTGYPSDTNAIAGEKVSLSCCVLSEVPAKIFWLREIKIHSEKSTDEPEMNRTVIVLDNITYQMLEVSYEKQFKDDWYSVLEILNPTEQDAGNYSCWALNYFGFSSHTVSLQVETIPGNPYMPYYVFIGLLLTFSCWNLYLLISACLLKLRLMKQNNEGNDIQLNSVAAEGFDIVQIDD